MIKSFLFTFSLLLFTAQVSFSQNNKETITSDPEAKTILDAVSQKYESYKSLETGFELEIAFPEQEVQLQKGTLARSGDRYRVVFGNQEIFSDGKALYMVLHQNKSVQINDLPEEGEDVGFLSPESIFTFYDNGKFEYILMDTRSEGGKVVHFIELKPTDRGSEYSKFRMIIERDSKKIVSVIAFAKDASRYTFKLRNLNANKQFASDYFAMNKTKYPEYYVEDLRD